jgi:hypothetical protein
MRRPPQRPICRPVLGHIIGSGLPPRLPAVWILKLTDAQNNEPILLVESEKDVLARNFHKADPTPLYGAQIIAIAHDDESGEKWARQVVAALDGKASALHGARIMQRLAEPRPGHPRSPTSLHRPLSC